MRPIKNLGRVFLIAMKGVIQVKAYVCVYRQPIREKEWMNAWKKAGKKPSRKNKRLKKYLRRYRDRFDGGEQGCFYDWGDDPSFFCAEDILGDVRSASWGVCRPDVRRSNLSKGDFVIFFCARQQDTSEWEYYYIGVGTVREVIKKRKRLWQKDKFVMYRKFYNLLTNAKGKNCELVGYHKNWEERAKSPYVIFAKGKTHFNITDPILVATFRNRKNVKKRVILEKWNLKCKYARRIYGLIPARKGGKKLRTSWTGNGHTHMNLSRLSDKHLKRVRRELLEISREIADE